VRYDIYITLGGKGLREEHRLRVFGNRALREMFGWVYKGRSDRGMEKTAQ
jgi:hypothetical protein